MATASASGDVLLLNENLGAVNPPFRGVGGVFNRHVSIARCDTGDNRNAGGDGKLPLLRLRPQPPAFPPNVRRWVNIVDRDDFIAAEPDLRGLFSAGMSSDAVFEAGYTVDNGADPHSAGFYLGKAQLGKPVGEVLWEREIQAPLK